MFHIEPSDRTPEIICNPEDHTIVLSGISIPEDGVVFFSPFTEWIQKNVSNNEAWTLKIFLTYYNTVSSHMLRRILEIVTDKQTNGTEIKVLWMFEEEDLDMEEAGEDYIQAFPSLNIVLEAVE